MGHEVHHRTVTLGEDLSQYDEVIVYIASPNQRVAKRFYEGLWTISQHPNCILSFDDWQVKKMWKDISKTELFKEFILKTNGKNMEEVKSYEKELRKGLEIVMSKKNRMLIAAYSTSHLAEPEDYGPHVLFDQIGYPRERVFVFNPNPYHRNRNWEDLCLEGEENPEWKGSSHSPTSVSKKKKKKSGNKRPTKKDRRFNFASLVQSVTRKWLKQQCGVVVKSKAKRATATSQQLPTCVGTWPLDVYGSLSAGQKRLKEDEMIKVMTRDWGCLMPKYEHAGSGWWRARPLQCADAGSILIGDDKELAVLYGWDYPFFGMTAREVSKMEVEELEEVAGIQRDLLYKVHPLDKSVQQEELAAVLSALK